MSRESSAPRTAGSLLRDPVFGPYFGAKLFSSAGIWSYNIVAAILVYDLTRSAFQVGLVSVAQFAPQLVLAPVAGVVADRWDRRRLLIVGNLAIALGAGGLAVLVAVVGVAGLPGAWPILVGAGVVGIGFAISAPAQNALLPSLVERKDLAPAIALNSVPPTLARTGGPALGAVIAAGIGPATAFAIAAATSLLFIVVLWRLRVASHRRAASGDGRDDRVRAGLLHLRNDRASALLIVGVMAVSIGADPVLTLTPALAASFGGDAQLVGTLASAFGLGTAVTFLFLHRVRGRFGLETTGTSGLVLLAAGIALTSFATAPPMAIGTLMVAGIGFTLSMTAFSTLLQQRLPEEVRGRVMALWSVAFLGSRPMASALHGSVADGVSNQAAFLTSAAAVGVIAWFSRPAALRRRVEGLS